MIFLKILPFFLIFLSIDVNAIKSDKRAHFYQDRSLKKAPRRIISLSPVVTEVLFALSLDKNIVGVTRFCDRPAAAHKLPKIGGFIDPQLEQIIKLKPDLVIAQPQAAIAWLFAKLTKRGIATFLVFSDTISEIENLVLGIGKITGRELESKKIVQSNKYKLDSLAGSLSTGDKKPKKVLLVVSAESMVIAGADTFASQMLSLLGVKSAAGNGGPKWPVWPLEKVLQQAPDIIVATEGKYALATIKRRLSPILDSPKMKKCRILAPDKPLFQRPGIYLYEDGKILKNLLTST